MSGQSFLCTYILCTLVGQVEDQPSYMHAGMYIAALLHLYRHACRCQLLTDEGSHSLPKHLNYCFSVLVRAANQLI